MVNDNIVVFSKLTKSELSECSLFEDILDSHYEKFKFFYSLIKNLCLKNVEKIICKEQTDKLLIFIYFKTKTLLNNFNKSLTTEMTLNKYNYANYFILNIDKEPKTINISIWNKGISEESEIYEN